MKNKFLRLFGCISIMIISVTLTKVSAAVIVNDGEEVLKTFESSSVDIESVDDITGGTEILTSLPENNDGDASINGTSKPSSSLVWNLSTNGAYAVSGIVQYSKKPLYTNYNFTGASQINVSIDVLGDDDITITLYKNGIIDSSVDSFTAKAGTCSIGRFTDLSSGSKYYLKFSAPCEFEGTIYSG